MIATDTIPLIVVAFLLLSAGGADVERVDVVFDGTHAIDETDGPLVVAGGSVTVPKNATVDGPVQVVGGELTVAGEVRGNLRLLGGSLTVTDGGSITGQLETLAGQSTIAPGAAVGSVRTIDVTTQQRSPVVRWGTFAIQSLVLAAITVFARRRSPRALANVADSIAHHSLVSAVVGGLAGLTLVVLFVYMAFTLILLPVSLLGLAAELLVVGYAYVVFGYLVGERVPLENADLAAGIGAAAFLVGIEVLGAIPVLGVLVQGALVATGFGAVLLTFFGLREFEPATIPGRLEEG